ncbi:MAG TPA: LamG domain-containing protein [Bacteroidota bacterium]
MITRRPVVTLSLITLVSLSCTSPKSAGLPLRIDVPAPAAQGREIESRSSVAIDLRDGSRIIGTPLLIGLTLGSSYGSIPFKLEQVTSIVFSDSAREVTIEFRNGDLLRGSLQLDSLPVQCVAGRLNLPVSAILRISPVSTQGNLAEGLVAHYPLKENTADATGHGHDAVNHGAVPARGPFGNQGGAYEFDGTDAHINLPGGIVDPNAPAYTLSVWVLAKPSPVRRQALYIGAESGELAVWIDGGKFGFGAGLTDRQWHAVTSPAQENIFVHLAGVYVRGKWVRLYVNGERKSEAPVPDLPLRSGLTEYSSGIGSYAPEHPEHGQRLGMSPWYGRIGDVRIYNRAMSDSEIMSLVHQRD